MFGQRPAPHIRSQRPEPDFAVLQGATGTPAVTYEYDRGTGFGIGQLDRVATAGVSTMAYGQFDALGRIGQSAESVLGNSYLFGYRYNLAGSLVAETYPSGRTVTMQYDAANRATQVADSTVYVAGVQYAAQGGFQSYVYGNGLRRFYAYNQRMQPAEMTDVPAAGGCAASAPGPTNRTAWALDLQLFWGNGAGQVSTNNGDLQSELIQTCNGPGYTVANNYYEGFLYDPLNRLFAFREENGADERDFRYDNWGNVWVSGNSGALPALSASTPTSNIYSGNQRTDTTYDAAGNETSVAGVCAAGCLQYDAESRQTGYAPTGTSYAYDGDGRRVISTANGVSTVFVYDALGNLAAKYTSGVGGAAPCTTCYLSWDHLGSTRMVTDQAGNLVARHDYLAFGEEIRNGYAGRPSNGVWGGLDPVSQKFTGKERDSESGLDYFGARYYGSTLGRFLSVDPASAGADPTNPQSWNAYSYVLNNPLSNTDPNGQDICADGSYADVCVTDQGLPPIDTVPFPAAPYTPPPPAAINPGLVQPPSLPPKTGTTQTFSQCMAAHATDFSIAGALNHTYNAITGSNSLAFQNNFFAQAVLGNPITTLAYGSATDNAGTAASLAPTIVQMGMGTVTSYGRRTTTIMALNLAGKGGVPLALGAASAGTKAAIGRVANVAGGFMSLEVSLAVNVGFTAAEAAYCASQP